MQPGYRLTVHAHGISESGAGLARVENRVVEVANLLPDEKAEVVIDHVSRQGPRAWAHVATRHTTSPARSDALCPAFGRCGGCAWQHLTYPEQLKLKRHRIVDALDGVVESSLIASARPSPKVAGYRNKGKYVVGLDGDGKFVLGAYAPRSHHVVSTLGCTTVNPIIDNAAGFTRDLLANSGLVPYDEKTRTGHLRYVVIRVDADDNALFGFVTTSDTPRDRLVDVAQWICKRERGRGVSWHKNDRTDGAIFDGHSESLAGQPRVPEEFAGVVVDTAVDAFVQINRRQAAAMYRRIAELALPAQRAADVYCGLGGIALHLAAVGIDVVAIERSADVIALQDAAATAGLPGRVRAIQADSSTLKEQCGDVDAVVVNPPRRGLDAATRQALLELEPETIIYVSCGPTSLARDLAELSPAYAVDTAEPFDFMPGTAQIETLVRCLRR